MMWLSLIWFILVLFVFWNLLCTIRIKYITTNQTCFYFVLQKPLIKLFYMTHTFDSEVSLHSWLIWPTVRRGTPGVGVILYYGFNNRRCAGKPGRFILWIFTKKQMEVLYCHELFIFRKLVRFMPISWVCEYSIVKGFVCTLLVFLKVR